VTARDARTRHDAVADAHVLDIRADLGDTSDELVPEHNGWAAENRAMIPFRCIRATDRSAEHFEHDVTGSWSRRIRDVLYPDVTRPVEDRRSHALSTRSGP
jgi:hypothetical protein